MSTQTESWGDSVGKRAPNFLTFFRILLVPVFVVLMNAPSASERLWATCIFVVASLTDWLDGYIARLYKAESILGTLLDPLADKILVMAALVLLAAEPIQSGVPAWMVVVILGREMMVTGLRSLASLKGEVVPASGAAKHKTAWTFLAVVFLLIDQPYRVWGFLVPFHAVGMWLLWFALILTIVTGIDYAIRLRRVFQ